MKTFSEWIKKKHYNIYRDHKTEKVYSIVEAIALVNEYEEEKRLHLKILIHEMEKED